VTVDPNDGEPLFDLLQAVRGCRICAAKLPLGPRPIVQIDRGARLLIASQAPGRKAHLSGVPFEDASGDTLRAWLGIDRATFYESGKVAILPRGFCYPGRGRSGDLPPSPECAPLWHARLLRQMPNLALTLVIGRHADEWFRIL
jgi:uracil-DNA glycosylase